MNKYKTIITALLFAGSAQATTWVPFNADSVNVNDKYTSEYTVPTNKGTFYAYESAAKYNTIDASALYKQTNPSVTVNANAIAVLDNVGKTILVVQGSVDTGYKSDKLQIDPKAKLGATIIHKASDRLTLTASLIPLTIFGGDKTEQSCYDKSCYSEFDLDSVDLTQQQDGHDISAMKDHKDVAKNESFDFNLGASYSLLKETDGDIVDLTAKAQFAGQFSGGQTTKGIGFTMAKDLYEDDNTLVKASITPTYNGTDLTTGAKISIEHEAADGSYIEAGVGANFANGEVTAVPSLKLIGKEGVGISWSPLGFGIAERFKGKTYSHSVNPYVILIQAVLGQRTILDMMNKGDEVKVAANKPKGIEPGVFNLPSVNGINLYHDKSTSSILGFDAKHTQVLNIKVIEQEGLLFLADLSGAYDANGTLYKF